MTMHTRPYFRLSLTAVLALFLSGCLFQVRQLKTENAMLEQRVLQHQQDLESAEGQVRACRRDIAALDEAIAAKDAEIASLREREAATRRVMTEAQKSQAEALVTDMQERVERENELRLQVEELAAKLEMAENDKRLLESQRQEKHALADELLDKLEESADRIDEMALQADGIRAERDDARAERDDYRRQLQAAEAGSQEAAAQMEDLSTQLRDREKELAAARREAEEAKAKIAEKSRIDEESAAARKSFNESVAAAFANTAGVEVVSGDEPRVVLVSDTLFQTGTVLLSDEGLAVLQRIAAVLGEQQWSRLVIEGHTDNTPVRNMPFVDNWDLAAARAATVARWLASRPGVSASAITATSHAYFDPRASNDTADGRRRNRRVEIVVIP